MNQDINIEQIKRYFSQKLETFGTTPQGADWNSQASQYLRFNQLINVCDTTQEFSILDYGCGYGALVDYLLMCGHRFKYIGFDIVEEMVVQARQVFQDKSFCSFTSQLTEIQPSDYVVESGIFNLRLDTSEEMWRSHVIQTLEKMNTLSRKGFAFNLLTSYSDPEYMKPHLYYADPNYYFDYCKRNFSKNVALLHDYNLYDFTILVRKAAEQDKNVDHNNSTTSAH